MRCDPSPTGDGPSGTPAPLRVQTRRLVVGPFAGDVDLQMSAAVTRAGETRARPGVRPASLEAKAKAEAKVHEAAEGLDEEHFAARKAAWEQG